MTAEESARFVQVLGEAFSLGERLSAYDGFVKARRRAILALPCAVRVWSDIDTSPGPDANDAARVEVAHVLLAALTLAGQLGLDATLGEVDAIVRASEEELDRRLG